MNSKEADAVKHINVFMDGINKRSVSANDQHRIRRCFIQGISMLCQDVVRLLFQGIGNFIGTCYYRVSKHRNSIPRYHPSLSA